ncbi:MAG TPA: hypothetical protein VG297_08430 [Bryobacteraceae bacterium]|jgi:uncharacterized protein (TIGR03437 family)|nr:hypothetical protein [Bryobacteraceae bacterium]
MPLRFLQGRAVFVTFLLLASFVPAGAQTLQWARQFASPKPNATFQIAADATGVYMVGVTQGALPGQTATSTQDGFVRKYDSTGTILWTRQFALLNGQRTGPMDANGIAVDSTGVYIVGIVSTADLNGPGRLRVGNSLASFVTKYDTNGTLLWTKQSAATTTGGESASSVTASGGAIYVTGGTFDATATTGGPTIAQGIYLRKFDTSGNILWTSQFGSSTNDIAYSVTADSSGAYIVGTTTKSLTTPPSTAAQNLFVRKYDPAGNVLWTQQFGTPNSEYAYSVSVNSTGVFVVGSTQGLIGVQTLPTFDFDGYVRKYDTGGNLLWTRQFGGADREEAFNSIADSTGLYVVGYTRDILGAAIIGGDDVFLRRYDNDGNALWTIQTGSVNNDFGYGVAADSTGVYIGGYTGALIGDSFLYKYTPPAPGGPVVLDGGTVNSASFAPNPSPVAPGSIATIFGTGLNDGSQVLSSSFGPDGTLVRTLGGTSVTVGNLPAPIFFSTSSQLGIQIPLELVGQTSAQVVVTVAGQASAPRTVNLTSVSPGLYTLTSDGRGQVISVHADGVTLITPANPAHPNETITLLGTGLGPVAPLLLTGQPASLNQTVSIPVITIDGLPAQVVFSGIVPTLVGLYQVNVVVPGLARQNAADPVVLTINNVPANPVTLAVAP